MTANLNATKKGLLTGTAMIGLSLLIYFTGMPFDSPVQYLIYLVYAAGISWSVYSFARMEETDNRFATRFQQGFKCFIVVTLMMVLFTYIFNKLHPEFKDAMVKSYREELQQKGNSTPGEIDRNIAKAKDFYLTMLISGAIFGYLILGGVIAALSSLIFRKRNT